MKITVEIDADEQQFQDYVAQFERVLNPGEITKQILEQIVKAMPMPEPPLGSIIRDGDGDTWWRGQRGWRLVSSWGEPMGEARGARWSSVFDYGPIEVIHEGRGPR